MHPIGPAPNTTTVSPSSIPSSSWALMAQANGSAADASSIADVVRDAVQAVDLEYLLGTIMYSAKPPSYWYPIEVWFWHTAIQPFRHS